MATQQQQNPDTQAVALRNRQYGLVVGQLEKRQSQIGGLLQRSVGVDRFMQTVKTALQKNPALLNCTPESIVNSVLLGAELGLLINTPHQHAALIPYKTECTLQPMYKGLVLLAVRAGGIKRITAEVVYEGDVIDVDLGVNRNLVHKPALDGARDDNKIIGAYAVYVLPDGERDFCWMPISDILKTRDSSRAKDDGPWVNWFAEQCKKTVVKRALKLIPNSDDKTSLALAADNAVESTGSMAGVVVYDAEGECIGETTEPQQSATQRMQQQLEAERGIPAPPPEPAAAPAPVAPARRGRPAKPPQLNTPVAPAPPPVNKNPFAPEPEPAAPAAPPVHDELDPELDLGPDPLTPQTTPTTPKQAEAGETTPEPVKVAGKAAGIAQHEASGLDETLVKRVLAGGEALGTKMFERLLSEIGVLDITELDNDGMKLLLRKMNAAAATQQNGESE
jgi:recombination protein RecT